MKKEKEKSLQLNKASLEKELENKTAALDKAKRELKIEASLETVRAVALLMKKREDMLQVCRTIAKQLELLHVKEIRNVQTAIFYEDKGIYTNYEYYAKHDKAFLTDTVYTNHEVGRSFAAKMLKGKGGYMVKHIKGDKVKDWLAYQKATNVFIDDYLNTAASLNYYWFSLGPVALGISTYSPLNKKEIDLFRRFLKVFELSYRRYLDIENAEAQAWEAQIELALERVRARTMAMQHSDELRETTLLLFRQFKDLGQIASQVSIAIFDNEINNVELYITLKGDKIDKSFTVEIAKDPFVWLKARNAFLNGDKLFNETLTGKELQQYNHLRNEVAASNLYDESENILGQKWNIYGAFFSKGAIVFSSNKTVPDATIKLLERFGKVFEQTYTRFLDLEKAEVQAREAKIEAALERTRTQSMLMQHSRELDDTLQVFHEQVLLLDIHSAFSFLWLPDESRERHIFWAAWAENNSTVFKSKAINYPLNRGEPATKQCLIDWKSKEPVVSYHVPPDSVENYFAAWSELIAGVEQLRPEYFSDGLYYVEAFMKYGCFGVMASVDLTVAEKKILSRFAVEFERAYTRFLDLQKAEAQARESQIEVALERVRSRTMAMFKSDELAETAAILIKQLNVLGIEPISLYIGIIKDNNGEMEIWSTDEFGKEIDKRYLVNIKKNSSIKKIYDGWMTKEKSVVIDIQGKELQDWLVYWQEEHQLDFKPGRFPEHRLQNIAYFSKGFIAFTSSDQQHGETIQLLERFAAVFNLTYTRFLDLQKAEAQAREAQIELSLERVRAKTMAMHNSRDVGDTVANMFDELIKLGIDKTTRSGIAIIGEKNDLELWTASSKANGQIGLDIGRVDLNMHPLIEGFHHAWKSRSDDYYYELAGVDLTNYFKAVNDSPDYPTQFELAGLPSKQFHSSFFFPEGAIYAFSPEPLIAEALKIFKRFTGVFGQTYRRYLDLRKAEAQVRHAQIETAMEKVRARSLAMQKPGELVEVAEVLRREMGSLGVEELETSSIYIVDETNETAECWYAIKDVRRDDKKLVSDHMLISLPETRVGREMLQFYTSAQQQVSILMQGESRREWINYCAGHSTVFQQAYYGEEIPDRTYHLLKFSSGYMGAASPGNISTESWDLLQRAAAVFSLAYTRFQDLQNAEMRAREAQIELALERVRARTMAMFKSDELSETAAVLFHQLIGLGIVPNRLYIGIIRDESGDIEAWATDEEGTRISRQFVLSSKQNESVRKMYDGWIAQNKSILIDMQENELQSYFHYLNDELHVPFSIGLHQKRRVQHIAYFSNGFIGMASPDEQSAETIYLLERFAGVFNLTYTRFVDLQKAEAQGREATIEAALERVRGRAMAMRNSDDLSSTASLVFTELGKLGINPIRSGVGIIAKISRKVQFYSAVSTANGDSLSLTGSVSMSGHPEFEKQYEAWVNKENYFTALKGEELRSYYAFLSPGYAHPAFDSENDQEQYGHWLMFSEGFLFAWSDKAYSATEINILDRFKKIVELTFKRYFDLKKSEANARDAVKQASLDRVRAETASMRTTVDLERITPLIWDELTILGIPFIRCGVFIMDEQQEQIHTFLSTPDGKAIAAFHLPYDTPGNFSEIVSHWHRRENYVNHWSETEFTNLADSLVKQGAIATQHQYISGMPKEGIYLHFLPFLQGMLYIGNEKPLQEDDLLLVQNLAEAFSTAYARYEDFNKLEAAKDQVEKTLVDLKQAQAQLVQAEKMASLGELTAGIAHEIQNPLNFVNNFSEVSTELIDEMKEEMEKGNSEEAKSIAGELKHNLEKINHHGKRAGDIVKGMLQHSRTGSANREPAHINKLADEYLRLAFHGLRSKDKSFHATILTEYDENMTATNIIPQDIGRVLLNLYANAFYAVAEKKKQQPENYEPTVCVRTKQYPDKIEISVEDNGNGIPQKVVDKIFQPFFTTKPTGQGTGLGLSLSYDIIKVHGGEIQVNTSEGVFTKMLVRLPLA